MRVQNLNWIERIQVRSTSMPARPPSCQTGPAPGIASIHRFSRTAPSIQAFRITWQCAAVSSQARWYNIHALDGGIPAWTANSNGAPLPTFDTPGVDFPIWVRKEKNTPVISAKDLKALHDGGKTSSSSIRALFRNSCATMCRAPSACRAQNWRCASSGRSHAPFTRPVLISALPTPSNLRRAAAPSTPTGAIARPRSGRP